MIFTNSISHNNRNDHIIVYMSRGSATLWSPKMVF